MADSGTARDRGAPPPSVRRRLAVVERLAARASSRSRLADAVVVARTPKLLRAATRIARAGEGSSFALAGSATTWSLSRGARAPTSSSGSPPVAPEAVAAIEDQAAAPPVESSAVDSAASPEAEKFKAMLQEQFGLPDDVYDSMFSEREPAAAPLVVPGMPGSTTASPGSPGPGRRVRILEGPAGEGSGGAAPSADPPPGRPRRDAKRLSAKPAKSAERPEGSAADPPRGHGRLPLLRRSGCCRPARSGLP